MNAGDAVCRSLGIAVEEVAEGRARLRMRISEDMLNGHGLAHGGYLFLLADAAFAHASNARGPVTLAQSAQVTFLRPAEAGEELLAEATERVRYGRHGVYDVTVRRPCGEIVAEFRGQSITVSGRPGFSDRPGRPDGTNSGRPVSSGPGGAS
ncbi:hydroxyphenylacetyl-CoA thioesterase PaaI [Streptosporangium saharense]|uniref:Acyl-CoA thioesterase n=1 Tax=Streptosporangium saharense TaxID=1706840 RepID=A0A7W7VME0_9ACTN|nr:hydroxyphenylacetyl-CoA thioesterase PaaI [Streptosporangium saharense]MBB4915706.1 acyl-CoA thioesterase [Streptosporangium saharense]